MNWIIKLNSRLIRVALTGIILCAFVAVGCNRSTSNTPDQNNKQKESKESLVKVNRYMTKIEKEEIENYISRHGWEMKETGSGLRYMIYKEGTGERARKGQVVEMEYRVLLITGDVVYSSDESGPMIFTIGHGGVETGLEEAVLLLKKGDRAKVIIPSHLAHGFLGDDNKIPPRSTVIYDINIINLK